MGNIQDVLNLNIQCSKQQVVNTKQLKMRLYPVFSVCPEQSCKRFIGFKALVLGTFNHEKTLLGVFSVIVKTDGWFAALVQCVSSIHVLYWLCWWRPGTGHTRGEPPVAGVTEPCCHCGCQESTGGATQTGTLSTLSTHYLHTIYNKHYTICIIYTIFAISCKQQLHTICTRYSRWSLKNDSTCSAP